MRHLTLSELEQYFETLGEKKFRARQVYEWIWQKHAHEFRSHDQSQQGTAAALDEDFLPACADGRRHAIFRRRHDQKPIQDGGRSSGRRRADPYRRTQDGLCLFADRLLAEL